MDSLDRAAEHLKGLQILIRVAEQDYQDTKDERFNELLDTYRGLQCSVLWFYRDLSKENELITECEKLLASL